MLTLEVFCSKIPGSVMVVCAYPQSHVGWLLVATLTEDKTVSCGPKGPGLISTCSFFSDEKFLPLLPPPVGEPLLVLIYCTSLYNLCRDYQPRSGLYGRRKMSR